jgi:hypothetical protein
VRAQRVVAGSQAREALYTTGRAQGPPGRTGHRSPLNYYVPGLRVLPGRRDTPDHLDSPRVGGYPNPRVATVDPEEPRSSWRSAGPSRLACHGVIRDAAGVEGLDIFDGCVYVCLTPGSGLRFQIGITGGVDIYGRVGVWSLSVRGCQRWRGISWERDRILIVEGEGFRVGSLGTDVSRVVVPARSGVARCVGIADASLSLSLSLVLGGARRI